MRGDRCGPFVGSPCRGDDIVTLVAGDKKVAIQGGGAISQKRQCCYFSKIALLLNSDIKLSTGRDTIYLIIPTITAAVLHPDTSRVSYPPTTIMIHSSNTRRLHSYPAVHGTL